MKITILCETSFIIEVQDFQKINDAKAELQSRFDNLTISLIDNNLVL